MRGAPLRKNTLRIKHLTTGFFAGAIITCVILSFSHINDASTLMLIIFNFLFVSLVFPLDGTFTRKITLLLIGNMIGLVWDSVFSSFAYVAGQYFGGLFNSLYIILNPLLNLVWIVSFWSISLSVLASSKKARVRLKT